MNRFILVGLACFAMALPVSAQVTVIGGGLAEDCYIAVKADTRPGRDSEQVCTQALENETMTRKNRAATYVNRGIVRMRLEAYDRADQDFTRAAALKDDLGDIYVNRGVLKFYQADYQGAIDAINTALELETSEPHVAYYNRALAKEELDDLTGAYFDFLAASELEPEWELVQRQLDRFSVSGG